MREFFSRRWLEIRGIWKTKSGKVGISVSLGLLAVATFAPVLATSSADAMVAVPFLGPSWAHPLGTDDIGSDILSQLIWATRGSLVVCFAAGGIAALLGVTVGLLAGYHRGRIGEVLMRITDIVLVLPILPLLIVIAAFFPPSVFLVVSLIGLLLWPWIARVVRSQTLSLVSRPFVDASRLSGMSSLEIMFKVILPNQISLVILYGVSTAILAVVIEAGLDFIGLAPPNSWSWGIMLYFALSRNAMIRGLWWWFLPPGLLMALLGMGLLLIGHEVERVIGVRS